jgi:predicted permease
MAVRAALGSSRGRLIRQVFAETVLLSAAGAALGLLFGQIGSRAFERSLDFGATDLPIALDFSFDWRVFAYGMAAALVSASVIAIWPAMRASRANAIEALHDGSRGDSGGPARHRLRSLLAGGQIAGSLVLLVVAALFVRDLRDATRLDLGFTPDNLLNLRMDPEWAGYDAPRTATFYRQLEEKVRALPGVRSATLAYSAPLGYYWDSAIVEPIGGPANPDEQPAMVPINYVGPEYFDTMEIEIVRGRPFEKADAERGSSIAIVNETMAARFWPNQNPIGGRFRMRAPDWLTVEVVGVASNGKYINLFESPQPYIYLLLDQYPKSMRVLHVRSSLPPEVLSPRVQETIASLGPDVPVADVRTMRGSLEGFGGFMILRIGARQAGAIGGLGLLLAVIGVYGVASYATAQRTREIGIRMALGAGARDILQLVLRQGTLSIACGVVAGLLGALAMAAVLTRVLGMQDAADSRVLAGVAGVLGAIALAACYLPARRALLVTPAAALREE